MTAILAAILLTQGPDPSPHSNATLLTSAKSAAPGEKVLVGVQIALDPGWHCYWQNPGDSGQATSIDWKLPKGWQVGPLMWPAPEALETGGFTIYGYEKQALLMAYVTPPKNAKPGKYRIQANPVWLICRETCVPAKQTVVKEIQIGANQPNPKDGPILAKARAELPQKATGWVVTAIRHGKGIDLKLQPKPGTTLAQGIRFLAADPETIAHSTPQTLTRDGETYVLGLTNSEFASKPPKRLRGLLIGAGTGFGIEIDVPITSAS